MGVVGGIIFILINVVVICINMKANRKHRAQMRFLNRGGLNYASRGSSEIRDSSYYYEVAPDGNCELYDGSFNLVE